MLAFIKNKALSGKLLIVSILVLIFLIASSLLFLACSIDGYTDGYTTGETENDADGYTDDDAYPDNCTNDEIDKDEIKKNFGNNQYEDHLKKPRIGLYAGKGSWPENITIIENFLDYYGFSWSVFDEEDAVNLNLIEEFDTIWLAGGFSAEYKYYIKDHSNIKNFINEGGLFIGTCAGAYYAADVLRWKGTDYEYPLKLFKGKGIGPMSGLIGWGETSTLKLEGEHPANLGFKPERNIYYFDGPYFKPYDEEAVTVLARYTVNDQPAVIIGDSGAGHYLLMGPHPEIGDSWEQTAQAEESKQGAQWPWLYQLIIWVYNNSDG